MIALALLLFLLQIPVDPPIEDSAIDFPVGKSDGLVISSPLKGEDKTVFVMDRRQWIDPKTTVVLEVSVSVDGGTPEIVCSATASGGVIKDYLDQEITETSIKCPLPQPNKDVRELKIDMTVAGGNIKTQIDTATYSEAAAIATP